MEWASYNRTSTLLRSFDLPRIVGPSVFAKYVVVDIGVDILGVDECAIYIEDASSNRRKFRSHLCASAIAIRFRCMHEVQSFKVARSI
jgi:hypothetical protein